MNITTLLKKHDNGERLFKYEETYLKKQLIKNADETFNRYIRYRDEGKACVSFGAEHCKNIIQNACHRIPCERYSHRRDEKNVNGGCSSCNGFNKQEHQKYYTIWMIKKYGSDWAEEQNRIKNKKKPDIDYLIKIINTYENKSKNLLLKKQKKSV